MTGAGARRLIMLAAAVENGWILHTFTETLDLREGEQAHGLAMFERTEYPLNGKPYGTARWAQRDDGEVYFGGAVTQGWLTGDDTDEEGDDLAYGIDRFGEADAGAVLSLFRAQDLEGTRLLERYRELDLVRDDGWVQVYG